ncbi:MAG: DMT family transporter [Crocinitomicaceae bacterium]|nr:DMT family transporter [Crocinitomicaceae bacterium]
MFKGILAVFFGAASYGILSTIAKLSYKEGYSPEDATVFQILFGFIVLLFLNFFQKHKFKFKEIGLKEWGALSFGGATIALTSLFYYSCVQHIPASIGIILLFQFIWIGFLLDYFLNKQKPSALQLMAVLVLLLGTFLAAGGVGAFEGSNLNTEGLILGLLSALCYALYIFINGRLNAKISPLSKSMVMMAVSTIIVLILLGPKLHEAAFMEVDFLLYGIPLALFGAVFPPILFAYGVPKIGVTFSSVLSSVELPVAVVISILLLHESVSALQWIGIILILSAILIVSLFKK